MENHFHFFWNVVVEEDGEWEECLFLTMESCIWSCLFISRRWWRSELWTHRWCQSHKIKSIRPPKTIHGYQEEYHLFMYNFTQIGHSTIWLWTNKQGKRLGDTLSNWTKLEEDREGKYFGKSVINVFEFSFSEEDFFLVIGVGEGLSVSSYS